MRVLTDEEKAERLAFAKSCTHRIGGVVIDTYPEINTCEICGAHHQEGRGWFLDWCCGFEPSASLEGDPNG